MRLERLPGGLERFEEVLRLLCVTAPRLQSGNAFLLLSNVFLASAICRSASARWARSSAMAQDTPDRKPRPTGMARAFVGPLVGGRGKKEDHASNASLG